MNTIIVKHKGPEVYLGSIRFDDKTYTCALGKTGITDDKHEGDNATPRGQFKLRELWYRADRLQKPETQIPIHELSIHDGWCDDASRPEYNRHVSLPFSGSHETLWRDDYVYDLIVPISYNDDTPVPGKGSAIFVHVAREGYTPTAGCLALMREDLLEILQSCNDETILIIE